MGRLGYRSQCGTDNGDGVRLNLCYNPYIVTEQDVYSCLNFSFHSRILYCACRCVGVGSKMNFPTRLRNTSIRRKSILIALLSTGAATFFAILVSAVLQWFILREELVQNITAHASIIAANSTTQILTNDHKGARKTVGALAGIDSIIFAGILDKQGNDFALYVRPGLKIPSHRHQANEGENHFHAMQYIEVSLPVFLKEERIGLIHVRSGMEPVYEKLRWNMLLIVATGVGAFLVAITLLLRLLPTITAPLQYLVSLMERVSRENDFGVRAKFYGTDETGKLAQGFNSMLAQIQSRDEQLEKYREDLEEEVALRTDRLTQAYRIAHLGHWEWDILANKLYWSDEIYRIFGFTPQQFDATYEAFMQSVHPEDRQTLGTRVRETLELGRPYSIDHRIVLSDGTVRYVHEQAEITRDGRGMPLKMLGTVQDITERKLIEQNLAESERKFRTILDVAVDGILMADAQDQTFVTANRAICDMLGYLPEELYRLGVKDIHPAEALPHVQQQFERQLKGEIKVAKNLPVQRKDGSVFFADVSSAPLILAGRPYVVGVFHDVTERKQAEEEIALQATTDPLTGIANRREFHAQLKKEVERSKRYATPLSLIMYDIDHFKRINDTFGHDAGDSVLRELAELVKRHIRTVDTLARWGGEEFMIIMPQSDGMAAGDAAEKLRGEITQHPFKGVGTLTVSFGVTAFTPHDDINAFLKRVDDALYQAKKSGRNRVNTL